MTRGSEFSAKIRNPLGSPKRRTMTFTCSSPCARAVHEFSFKIRSLPEGAS